MEPVTWAWIFIALGVMALVLSVVLRSSEPGSILQGPRTIRNLPTAGILVHSFDGYRRYWPGWYHFFQKHHSDPVWPIYFATEEKSVAPWIPDHPQHHHLLTGKGSWGYRLMEALKKMPEEYVLYMQEDMWLTGTLRPDYLQEALTRMKSLNLNQMKLQSNCQHVVGMPTDYNNSLWYVVSHQPGLWKKSFLMSSLDPTSSPFQHETQLNDNLHRRPDLASLCRCNQDFVSATFPYEDVSRQGRLRDVGHQMLEQEGLEFVTEKDEVMYRAAQ